MSRQMTSSLEDYLEAIAELIAVNGHAHTKEIAEKLGFRTAFYFSSVFSRSVGVSPSDYRKKQSGGNMG